MKKTLKRNESEIMQKRVIRSLVEVYRSLERARSSKSKLSGFELAASIAMGTQFGVERGTTPFNKSGEMTCGQAYYNRERFRKMVKEEPPSIAT